MSTDAANRRVVALAVLAGAFPALDTAVNVAFPAIDEGFGLDVADLQWIVVCYLFTYGALLLGAGWLGDRIGHGRLVWWGGLVSIVGLGGCAAAPGFGLFLVARFVQGVGTALVLAGAPALLTTSAGEAGRGRAVGWFQAASMVGLAIGPVLGGPLVELGGWRSVFWFRVPIAVALVALASRLPALAAPAASADRLASVRGLWRAPGFVRTNALTAAANAAMFPTWLLVPTLLVDEWALAVVAAGFVLAVSPALSAAGSTWAGRALDTAAPERLARSGLLVQAAGLAVVGLVAGTGSVPAIVVGMALVGLGLGLFSVPNMHLVMSALPLDRQGVAGGLSLMMRTVGVVIGVTTASALFDAREAMGFDGAFRVVFVVAAVLSVVAAGFCGGRSSSTRR